MNVKNMFLFIPFFCFFEKLKFTIKRMENDLLLPDHLRSYNLNIMDFQYSSGFVRKISLQKGGQYLMIFYRNEKISRIKLFDLNKEGKILSMEIKIGKFGVPFSLSGLNNISMAYFNEYLSFFIKESKEPRPFSEAGKENMFF